MGFHLPGEFSERHETSVSRTSTDASDTSAENQIPLLSWEEALRHREVVDAENALVDARYSSCQISSHAPKSFRWVHHFSETHMSMPIVDGDVSTVYPGIMNQDIMDNVHCVAKFFPRHMHDELAEYLVKTLAGEYVEKSVYTWHSLPEYNFIVQIEFHKCIRYINRYGCITCIQIGETRDVTRAMHEHEALVSDIISRHRESIDHRFGNKIRMMHLLCQNSAVDELSVELSRQFERLTYEIEIRRNMFSNLPEIEPVVFESLIKEEFIKLDILGVSRHRLLFYDLNNMPLSPIVIQVLLLQDIASNAFKHGDGCVLCRLDGNTIVIANRSKKNFETLSNKAPHKRIGLETLRTVSNLIAVNIRFEKKAEEFLTTLEFGKIDVLPPDSQADTNERGLNPDYSAVHNYTWVLLDDEATICRLYQLLMKKRYKIDAVIIQTPADVANTVKIVMDLYRRLHKPIVLIMDEMLIEMDDNFDTRSCTGTDIRNKFFTSPVVSSLINKGELILLSSSASQVQDDRVLLKLGKTGSVATDVTKILNAVNSSDSLSHDQTDIMAPIGEDAT